MDKRLLYECKLLKQIVYKTKNQLGKTVQYRRLMHVYKSLKQYIGGAHIDDFELILVKAGLSVVDSLAKKFLVPVFSLLLAIYAKLYSIINENASKMSTKIISRKLKKLITLSKTAKKTREQSESNKLKEIESFLESIRSQI